jgi:hypothetical protein
MVRLRRFLICLLLLSFPLAAAEEEVFRVYTEHPRLFLRPHRLSLLRKEPSRQSMRWEQFAALMNGGVQPPEPGFAWALFHEISRDKSAGRKAVEWALSASRQPSDLRQLAIVFDWCQEALTPAESDSLAARIRSFLDRPPAALTLPVERDRVLAAIAIAERDQDFTEKTLRGAVTLWWRGSFGKTLGTPGHLPIGGRLYPLVELLHAVRDNLNIDLRESNVKLFADLPAFDVASHYPAPYPAAENEYRIPVFFEAGQPNLESAALSRAAGLALVAYDGNSNPAQYLQGWLIQDRFQLRGPFGAPYEFLWANPYQPGLAYVHMPLAFHDGNAGTLIVRASWEENSAWFGFFDGKMQLFENGKITEITGNGRPGEGSIDLGSSLILQGRLPMRFSSEDGSVFVAGLKPATPYDIEIDDEEMYEVKSDAAGIVALTFRPGRKVEGRIHEIMTPPTRREDNKL